MTLWLYKQTEKNALRIADAIMDLVDSDLAKQYGGFIYVDMMQLDNDQHSPQNQLKGWKEEQIIDSDGRENFDHISHLEWCKVPLLSQSLDVWYEKNCYQLLPDIKYSWEYPLTRECEGRAEFMACITSVKGIEYLVDGYWRENIINLEKIIGIIPTIIKKLVIKMTKPLEIYVMIYGSNFDAECDPTIMGWCCNDNEDVEDVEDDEGDEDDEDDEDYNSDESDDNYIHYDKNKRIYSSDLPTITKDSNKNKRIYSHNLAKLHAFIHFV